MHKRTVTRFFIGVVGIICGLILVSSVCYAVPQTINYQGYLTNSVGNPLDGTVNIVFSLYNVSSGGSPLWTESKTGVQVTEGIFSVNLGSVNPIDLSFNTQYYLGITVGADAEMTPRQPLTSVGYAFMADTASDLNCTACVSESELDFTIGTGDITAVWPGTGLSGGGQEDEVTLNVEFGGSGSASTVARSDHNHTGVYASTSHNHDDRYYTENQLNTSGGGGQVHWNNLTSVPSGFADGVDNDTNTTYSAGTGLDLSGTQFYVLFGGSGSASTVAHSDHNHSGVYAPASHNHDALYVNTSGDDMTGVLGMKGHSVAFKTSGGSTIGYIKAHDTYDEIIYHANGAAHMFEAGGCPITANFDADVYVQGNCVVYGSKPAAVITDTYGTRLTYAIESTEVWFEDFGSGQLDNGVATIQLDPIFLETVTIDADHPMKVFVTLTADCNGVYVVKGSDAFQVKELNGGESNATFDYRIAAKRKGYEDERLRELVPKGD